MRTQIELSRVASWVIRGGAQSWLVFQRPDALTSPPTPVPNAQMPDPAPSWPIIVRADSRTIQRATRSLDAGIVIMIMMLGRRAAHITALPSCYKYTNVPWFPTPVILHWLANRSTRTPALSAAPAPRDHEHGVCTGSGTALGIFPMRRGECESGVVVCPALDTRIGRCDAAMLGRDHVET